MKNIKKIIEENYNVSVNLVNLLNRVDIDYKKQKNRKVYIIDGKYILKEVFDNNINFLEKLYKYLQKNKLENYIEPIINKKNNFVTNFNNNSYLLFYKYDLEEVQMQDFDNVINSYFDFYGIIKGINKIYLKSNYKQDVKYFIIFSQRVKIFNFILSKFNINKNYFYDNIKKYLNYLNKSNSLEVIYSSLWLGNTYKLNNKIIFLDLDSIKLGDILFDMVSILNLVYYFYINDKNKRYKYYIDILSYYNKIKTIDYDILGGLLYYWSFRLIIDIDDTKIKILLKDIKKSYDFMQDFKLFLIKNNDIYI